MASITAQTAHSANAPEHSAPLCQSDSRPGEKTASPAATEATAFEFVYPPSEDSQAPRASIGPLDWRVPQGAFQLLVGATGRGKTTLLRNCKPSIAPHGEYTGELAVFGQPASQLDDRQSASLVGYVSQNPENQIVCDTVWHEVAFGLENLGTPQDVMRRRVAEVAHFFGFEPWFRRQVSELSGGQRQIVTLASALALRPSLLLLDEPTAQLDPVAEKTFLHALFRINRELGITVVVSTHNPEAMAEYATEAVCMDGGSLRPIALSEFDAQPLIPQPRSPRNADAPACITVSDAYCRYERTSDWVFRGFDLRVAQGFIHALIGGNGCGKSTLLRVIAGVQKLDRGTCVNALAQRQALLPQDPKGLFVCDTAQEELAEWQHACGYADADIDAIAQAFGLAERLSNHPYDLSGGQQQLLALAKLLLTKPSLLLLDEPTKGLDPQTKCQVAKAIQEQAHAGVTVVMATHDLPFAALVADEASMLFDGESAATQPAPEFFADNLFYRPMCDSFAKQWSENGAVQ